MLRLFVSTQSIQCQRGSYLINTRLRRPTCMHSSEENCQTVKALYYLCVDIQKIRKVKGWVLYQNPSYVAETASLLKDMGASGAVIARVLALYPEAVLCSPDQLQAQKELWLSVCPNQRELVGIIEKFPASFFTSTNHHDNQLNNICYLQSLQINKRIITKLMASAPQIFSRPVEQNKEMISTLQHAYLELGGENANMKLWFQKLLSQNPFILLKAPAVLRENLLFLRDKGFSTSELLHLLSKLRGFVTELSPDTMRQSLAYTQSTMACSEAALRHIVLSCPALLYYTEAILAERFEGLLSTGISMSQITQTPSVLELTTHIVMYRIQRLKAYGYDARNGSLEPLNGTKKDFEVSYAKLQLGKERPLFNPVSPLKADD